MEYVTLTGDPCFTTLEAQKLRGRINQSAPVNVSAVSGLWVYCAHVQGSRQTTQSRLEQLLPTFKGRAASHDLSSLLSPAEHARHSQTCWVMPRYNSPWSTKATSVAHVCGFRQQIQRVERGRLITLEFEQPYDGQLGSAPFRHVLYDRMTETLTLEAPDFRAIFAEGAPAPLEVVDIFAAGLDPVQHLQEYNRKHGLAMDPSEMEYLVEQFTQLGPRPPKDIELFMFAQINSEHCRHKQFNAKWTIDGLEKPATLFDMIKNTHKRTSDYTISAYSDNAAVLEGPSAGFWAPDYSTGSWKLTKETVHLLVKVETHNHPTAIAPFPGAATGSGGELRDEGSVGRGSMPKAGLCGFWVSDLLIPGHHAPWEHDIGRPGHYASSLDIMLEAPIGSARYNNEFGRACIVGCFRTLLTAESESRWRGYHKPIMIAGGMGAVRPHHALKRRADVSLGAHVIVLGGPAMLVGLGGGAASSHSAGASPGCAELDFDSVQRGNPEMQRRAQMVINACVALGEQNPIAMIHDVGAGGLSNALPELVKDAGFGGKFELRQVESADKSMSPLQIWCNEAQERYVLLVNEEGINRFASICRRERCGFSDVGTVLDRDADGIANKLVVTDRESKQHPRPIDLPMEVLFPAGRRLDQRVTSRKPQLATFSTASCLHAAFGAHLSDTDLFKEAVRRVFWMPAVGSKSFLITIADRTVGGLTVRDQMVGPWQTPVSDVGVTATSFRMDGIRTGEAMAMGEKPTLALISPAASARMAVAESLLNLGAADIMGGAQRGDLRRVKLSANWMAAVNQDGEGAALYEAVQAIGMELCPQLEISIPVGKDSMSMKASWKDGGVEQSVVAPVSVVISAFTTVEDVRRTWTPQLRREEDVGETILVFVDLAQGYSAMGGSALAQSLGHVGHEAPDVRDVDMLGDYFDALAQLHEAGVVLAYHDRSDGGLIATVAEMMFAGRCGVDLMMDAMSKSGDLNDMTEALFNEELGAVFQIRASDETNFKRCFATCGPPAGLIKKFGKVQPSRKQTLTIRYGSRPPFAILDRSTMQQWWTKTSYEMQRLRDHAGCAESEYATILDAEDPGLSYHLTFRPHDTMRPLTASISGLFTKAPRVAILREQGINGAAEMAFAFRVAGFDAVDVHMTDLLSGRTLGDFAGLVAPGGFSYGDVLGAGQGWAKSILLHDKARQELARFFHRTDTFALGVCNGCQMLSRLKELIPGTEHWPTFVDNVSQQFEARFSMVRVEDNRACPSVFLHGMSGSALPIVVSHGEGRAEFPSPDTLRVLGEMGCVPLRYVDNRLAPTEQYPYNPNGSPGGVAAVSNKDGRVLAMMPHPERTVLADVGSYVPPHLVDAWGDMGPWVRMFRSARRWVG